MLEKSSKDILDFRCPICEALVARGNGRDILEIKYKEMLAIITGEASVKIVCRKCSNLMEISVGKVKTG